MDNKKYIDTLLALGYININDIEYEYGNLVNNLVDLERLVKFYINDKDDLIKILKNCGEFISRRKEDKYGIKRIYNKACEIVELYAKYDIKAYLSYKRVLEEVSSILTSNLGSDFLMRDLNFYKLVKFSHYMETILITINGVRYRLTIEDSDDTFDVYEHMNGKLIGTGRVALVIKDGKEKFYYEHELVNKKELEDSYDYDMMIGI